MKNRSECLLLVFIFSAFTFSLVFGTLPDVRLGYRDRIRVEVEIRVRVRVRVKVTVRIFVKIKIRVRV